MSFEEVVTSLGELAVDLCEIQASLQNVAVLWTYYSVATLDDDEVSGAVALPGGSIVGEVAGSALPSQTTIQLRFATGRSRRILKKAIAGLSLADVGSTGKFTSTATNNWLAYGGTLLSTMETDAASWLYCYKSPTFPAETALVFPLSAAVSNTPKVQRRRRF
jgi:hypothetical protein